MDYKTMKAFEGIKLENIEMKNRIVRSATHSMLGNLDGTISEDELKMFEELAANDVGLIIAGQFFVSRASSVAPGSNELAEDRQIESAKKIMDVVKPYDARVIAQLNHAGSKSYSEDPYGPSELTLSEGKVARAITAEEIQLVKEEFVAAAKRAKKARFDGVQIHGAHGYLLCEFLKPSINKRDDSYGGSSENRFRLVGEIIENIKTVCGPSYPVFIKIDVNDFDAAETYTNDLKVMMKALEDLGVEAVEFSSSEFGMKKISEHNYFLERALEFKAHTNLNTILVGGMRHFEDMEIVLASGVDMVSMCRPFICEPDFITKLKEGQEKSKCVSCMKCGVVGRQRCILRAK